MAAGDPSATLLGGHVRLLRNNADDPKVLRDLELLAAQYGPGDPPPLPDAPGDGGDAEGEGGVPASSGTVIDDDVFVDRFVRVAIHVKRYFPYYLGAACWMLVMLLIDPRSGEQRPAAYAGFGSGSTGLAPSSNQSVESAVADVAPAPFADIGAASTAGGFGFPADTGAALAPAPALGSAASFGTGSFDIPTPSITIADEPEPLRIVRSGYSSATAGPLEQPPPGNGLPVAIAAEQEVKRSFVALSGDETVLRLKLVDDPSNVNAETARVRACPIVAHEWEAARGQSFDEEPLWNEPCVDGTRGDDGVWSFDLSTFGAPADLPGFALTAVVDPTLSFNLTFDPVAVTKG